MISYWHHTVVCPSVCNAVHHIGLYHIIRLTKGWQTAIQSPDITRHCTTNKKARC